MKRSPGFESADALEILALEPEPNLGVRRPFRPFPFCPFQFFWRARGGSKDVEGRVGEDRRLVDVGLDEGVSGQDGGAG